MSNFFIAIAVFLITVITALFAVPYLIDWNGYRGAFEEEATQLLGREVRVGGAVNLHLLPTPYFRLEKVRIADTSVNLQDAFIRVESLTIKLSVPPLFRGVVEANEIELQRPVLRLAVDQNDTWNWQSFGQTLGNAAYLPHNVTLTSVKITDGLLAVHGPDGSERARFEGFSGELSAPSLEGPYRYRGTFGKTGNQRELRIATARPEGDGAVRFKATLRMSDGASMYTLDGRLADLTGKPRIEGELSAKLSIAGLWRTPPHAVSRVKEPAGEGESKPDQSEAAFELRAAVNANPTGATLSNLALSFEQDGKPQLLTGELKALWRDAFAVEMSLSSRWLDLDRIAGAGDAAGPLDSIVPIAIGLRDLLPAVGRSRASFSVDQANVGREAVSALRLSLVRTEDKLEIEEFRLGLPGGSRGELQGVVSGSSDAPTFEGNLNLGGASLVRFLGWATAGAFTFDARGDGTFGIRTQLSIAPGRAAARDLVGDISGTAITAAAQYRWDGRPELSLLVEGPQLDARAFVPAGASLGDIFDLILHGPAASQAVAQSLGTAKSGWRSAQTDALVRVNAGQLMTAARTYRDVAMEIELKGGRLRLPLLRVAGDDGFSLELEGEVDDAASRPKGSLRGVVGADTAQAIAPLAELLGIPEAFRPGTRRAQGMVPLRLAGSMAFGARTPTSADLVLDGEANGSGVKLNARFDGGQGGWRSGPAELTGLIEGGDAPAVAAFLAPGGSTSRGGSPGSGRVMVKASGVPSDGLTTLASVEADDLALSFRGQVVAAEKGNTASGNLDIKVTDGTRIAALTGLAPPLRLDGLPIAGSLKFFVTGSTLAVDRIALKVGGSDVKGQIALSTAGDRRRVEARVDVDELSVAKLLAPLLDQRLAVAATAETAVTGRQSPWPDEPFDSGVLDAFEGTIQLTTKRFLLGDGIGLGQTGIDVALESGKVEVTRIEGAGLGGRVGATLRIAKAAAGVDISGSVRLTGGSIEALASNAVGSARGSGTISGELGFAGKGTSPRGVLSVLQGKGKLGLGEAKIATLWPGAVGRAAEAALRADPDSLPNVLRQTLVAGLGSGELQLPAMLSLEIADGRLVAKPFVIDTANGRAEGSASLDLKTLGFESDWRLEQKPSANPAGKLPLPGVTVTYRGPVAALGSLEPRINSEALERELAVRRMERDVEELERLRKLDEARRREEAERQRRQLEQAPLPPGAVPVAPAPRPATPG
jgi:uncharacterized protein involved in outer membrane biogenesis